MRHPFFLLPMRVRWVLLAALLALFLFTGMRADGGIRKKKLGSIVDLELAATRARAEAVLGRWRKNGAIAGAVAGVHWDFLFIVAYSCGLSLLCTMAAGARDGLWARAGNGLAWAATLAGACDVVENGGLLTMLSGTVAQPVPAATAAFAAVKFTLAAAALGYAIAGAVVCAWK